MTCPEFETRLSAYLDGELSRWRRWKVETHLRYCADCTQMLRELDEVDGALLTCAQEAATPDYLTAAVMHRLPAMPPAQDPRRAWLRRPIGTAIAVAVAGVQVVALGGAYWWGFLHGSDRPHATTVIGATGGAGSTEIRNAKPVVNTSTPTTPNSSNPAPGSTNDRSAAPQPRTGSIWTKSDPRYQPQDSSFSRDEEVRRGSERRLPRMPLSSPSPLPLPVAR